MGDQEYHPWRKDGEEKWARAEGWLQAHTIVGKILFSCSEEEDVTSTQQWRNGEQLKQGAQGKCVRNLNSHCHYHKEYRKAMDME